MPFNLTRIPNLPDERVTDIKVAAMWSGGALVSYMAADRLHYAWYWPETGQFKVLDDDLFDEDWRKDASGVVWETPRGLACLISHATDASGTGASSRLYGGTMDAPWVKEAREYLLNQHIDARALVVAQNVLQGGSGDSHEVEALKALVASLQGRIDALETALQGVGERATQAGRVLAGQG